MTLLTGAEFWETAGFEMVLISVNPQTPARILSESMQN